MFKIIPGISKKILIISIILLLSCTTAIFIIPGSVSAEPGVYPIMQISDEERAEEIKNLLQGPQAEIITETLRAPKASTSLSLIDHLNYVPVERDQDLTGGCWVWAGTGVMEVAKSVQDSVKDRFSIQYFYSNYNNGTGNTWAGMGGWLSEFAAFYNGDSIKKAIPWLNTNASFQDMHQSTNSGTIVPANTISTTPNYPITSITRLYIPTLNISQATAISNIKNILNQEKAVVFSFWLPAGGSGWTAFNTFWGSGAADALYNYDSVIDQPSGGGHSVLCIGYYEGATLADSYWIMVNSWGITDNRKDCIFRVAMNIDYSNHNNNNVANLTWETLNITYGAGTPILVNSIAVTGAGSASTVLNGASLQMNAVVSPASATTKDVTWSKANGTGSASIDWSTGVLTAEGVGTVTVTATANDGSGVTGTKTITVTAPPPAPAPAPAPSPGPAPGPASGASNASSSSFGTSLSSYEETTAGFATLYYNRILNRGPDEEGLNGWVSVLDSGGLTGIDVVNCFFSSEECQAKISGYTNEQFLTFLYGIIFDRLPDPGGLASWTDNMTAGMTQAEVVNNFARSVEFETLCDYFGVNPYPGYSGSGK